MSLGHVIDAEQAFLFHKYSILSFGRGTYESDNFLMYLELISDVSSLNNIVVFRLQVNMIGITIEKFLI